MYDVGGITEPNLGASFRDRFWQRNKPDYFVANYSVGPTEETAHTSVHLYLPKTEIGQEEFYLDSVAHAVDNNEKVWGDAVPRDITVLFIDTTARFNSCNDSPAGKKVKGDRIKADCTEITPTTVTIRCFTPQGIRTETDANISDPAKTPAEAMEVLLTHELTHGTIGQHYEIPSGRSVEPWINEALAMVVCEDYPWRATPELAKRLSSFLSGYTEPPNNTVLMDTSYPGQEQGAPVAYTYGLTFLSWSVEHLNRSPISSETPDDRVILKQLVSNYTGTHHGNFFQAYEATFELPYQEAFEMFKKDLAAMRA